MDPTPIRRQGLVEAAPPDADPDDLCEAILADEGDHLDDDVALLALRLDPPPSN